MFVFAFLIGIYSYLIFLLGIFGWLYKDVVVWFTVFFAGLVLLWMRRDITRAIGEIRGIWKFKKQKLFLFFIVLFLLQAGVNLTGVLGPERGFDALWYHLTLPKLWLMGHEIFFIPGGLLYYSAMPKLGEMLYIAGLSFGSETVPKFIHFSFGLFTCLALYKLQRKFFSPLISLIGVVIFYSNLVVGWQSITAYVDLIRTFFEIMALWGFINWSNTKKQKWLVISAMMVGLAIATKLLAIGSLVIFIILIILKSWRRLLRFARNDVVNILIFIFISLAIPMPWFIFSYINTSNPVYPFFTNIYKVVPESLSLTGFFKDIWILFTQAADPISPVYIIFLPLIIFYWKKLSKIREISLIGVYSMLAVIIWYFTPRTGGGRFILPYLPVFSILCAGIYSEILKKIRIARKQYLAKLLMFTIIFISIISVCYRFAANSKYLPVIFCRETKAEFLEKYLNFSFGDFYDVDGYFKTHIKSADKVLLYGFHNLYYVDFPFIDSSWLKKGDKFNYIATQNTDLPEQFKSWKLVYENDKTMVKLYKR